MPTEIQNIIAREGLQLRCTVKEPLYRHTTFRIGGPADIFLDIESPDVVCRVIRLCLENNIPWRVIGGGSNLLISDYGVTGMVIRLSPFGETEWSHQSKYIRVVGTKGRYVVVEAHGGIRAKLFLAWCVSQGLSGFEFIAGIPARIGGAIRMNAGTPLGCMADVVRDVEFVDPDGVLHKCSYVGECSPSYRFSLFPEGSIITSATFYLLPAKSSDIRKKLRSFMQTRIRTQPLGLPSAGCVFRNPRSDLAAGFLIDKCGLKGLIVGGAEISPKHANWIVNTKGTATARDVLELISYVKYRIFEVFNIVLQEEIEIWEETNKEDSPSR